MLPSLSAKAFAEFVVSGPSKRAQIARNLMKPDSKESRVVVLYYAPALRVIRLYHARNNDRDLLKQEMLALEQKLEKAPTPQARAKAKNNSRAIRSYMEIYGGRKRKILPRPRIYFKVGRVRLSASPDLAVEENGKIKLVKLGVTKDGDNPELVRIMLRVIYLAAVGQYKVAPNDVVYFDVANAARRRSSHDDADLDVSIDNHCSSLDEMC